MNTLVVEANECGLRPVGNQPFVGPRHRQWHSSEQETVPATFFFPTFFFPIIGVVLALGVIGCRGHDDQSVGSVEKAEAKRPIVQEESATAKLAAGPGAGPCAQTDETSRIRDKYLDVDSRGWQAETTARSEYLRDLRKRFGGINLTESGEDLAKDFDRLQRLMREWNPLGFAERDLHGILGEPTARDGGRLIYSYDNGRYRGTYEFEIEGGMVVALRIVPGY